MTAQPSVRTTTADAPEHGEVVVRLIAGASERPEIAFPIGRKAPLVSVGARGDWQVRGRGVASVHAVLAFNGAGIFVYARDGAQLAIDGARVKSFGWIAVPVGATLELGEVRLTVMTNRGCAPASSPIPPSSAPTRAIRLTRARSGEVTAGPSAPRIRRRAESADALSLLRDLQSATLVDSCGLPFGMTAQAIPPPGRAARPMDETASGPFATAQLALPVVSEVSPAEAGGPSFGTTQLIPPMAREVSPLGSFGTTQVVPPLARDARPVDASPAGDFGTTQLVPPIVRDACAPPPPAIGTPRRSSPGARRSSSPVRLPATDAYSDAPPPVVPADPRAIAAAPRPGIDSFGVTRIVPPMGWRSPLGSGQGSPVFDSFASTRLAPPLESRQCPPLLSSNVSGGHPLPDPMLASRMVPASPNGAAQHGLRPRDPGAVMQMHGAYADDSSSGRLTAYPSAIATGRAPTAPGAPHGATGLGASARRVADSFVRAWRSSSQPRKAIVVLLGPTLLAGAFSLRGLAAPPRAPAMPPVASTATATATVSAAPAPTAGGAVDETNADAARAGGPAVMPQPPAEVGLRPASSSKGAQQKTAERRALDAVAAGAGEAEQYDALAKEFPENLAFSEAARILRARASEAR